MEKLTSFIPQFRIGSTAKATLQEMAKIDRRKFNEFCRIRFEMLAEDYIKEKEKENKNINNVS